MDLGEGRGSDAAGGVVGGEAHFYEVALLCFELLRQEHGYAAAGLGAVGAEVDVCPALGVLGGVAEGLLDEDAAVGFDVDALDFADRRFVGGAGRGDAQEKSGGERQDYELVDLFFHDCPPPLCPGAGTQRGRWAERGGPAGEGEAGFAHPGGPAVVEVEASLDR